jgi:ubiquinone/menaquinone biosynthesis C-methylase UbiE
MNTRNIDEKTVASFGDEWTRYNQGALDDRELQEIFHDYFHIFPWHTLPEQAQGFDMGCGSGRWARLVAPRVGHLTCIDASPDALDIAKRNLSSVANVSFVNCTANEVPLGNGSQDFGYSLGVLHHIPDTSSAIQACSNLLKPGAPFLVYLYYRFDNRPAWYAAVWRASELVRGAVSRMPPQLKHLVTAMVAAMVYWPLARLAWLGERLGVSTKNLPLYYYRDRSFYTMLTDSRDRFGTPLEQRFTRAEIAAMMERAGLSQIMFSERGPFWCAVGTKHI